MRTCAVCLAMRLVEPATGLSAEISADHWLTFKDRDGKVVVKKSVANLPK